MKYNFDELIPRQGTNSLKWSAEDKEVLPMWIADMDFRTAPAIIEALTRKIQHGIFGYTKVPDEYFNAVIGWFARRHQFKIKKEELIFTIGVVPALTAIVKALTVAGDKVIVQSPVYNYFYSSITNDGRQILYNELLYKDVVYTMDFEDLERKASDPDARLLFLCNPHNPVGRVWTKEELTRLGEICHRNNVTVISDEVHCDLVYPGHRYTPFASISESFHYRSITCIAPSKTFNLAGLQCANIVAADEDMRKKINHALNVNEVYDISPFAVEALIAAYNEGEEWLDELILYLNENYTYLTSFFAEHLPLLKVVALEGTYLVWIDCTALKMTSSEIAKKLFEQKKLWVNEGSIYGAKGEGFIRINIACPRSLLMDSLQRLAYVLG